MQINTTPSRNLPLKNMLSELQVYCTCRVKNDKKCAKDKSKKCGPDRLFHCDWQGKLSDLDRHLLHDCQSVPVKCSMRDCAVEVPRCYIKEHEVDCTHRLIACKHCLEKMKAAEMERHVKECPSVPVSCDCTEVMLRSQFKDHKLNECPLTVISCPFEEHGCEVSMTRKDMEKHLLDATTIHQRLVLVALKEIKKELRETKAELSADKTINIEWTVGGIKAKLDASHENRTTFVKSPDFIIRENRAGVTKLYFDVRLKKTRPLELYLCKCEAPSSSTNDPFSLGGSEVTLLAPEDSRVLDRSRSFNENELKVGIPWGWPTFVPDVTPYIVNDSITITAKIKLKSSAGPIVLRNA